MYIQHIGLTRLGTDSGAADFESILKGFGDGFRNFWGPARFGGSCAERFYWIRCTAVGAQACQTNML